ncbi:MAG: ABC transporter substrate-binding protein [Thermodesulfobacteriota bacterium]
MKTIAALLCAGMLLIVPPRAWAADKRVGVLLSREIAPYVAMVEGLEARLRLPVQRFFLDESGTPYSLSGQTPSLNPQSYDALVAVGPEALRYLHPRAGTVPLLYGMVLNPRNVVGEQGRQPCGINLNIPAEAQLASILRVLPAARKIGVLFDPANNQAWFKAASASAAGKGIELLPLQVLRQGDRLELAGEFAHLDAILFIPDPSIISKAVIQHVIKQAVLKGTPVVGYNQFFLDSGATLALLIDYRKVGAQVARQVEQVLASERCEAGGSAPEYEAMVNDEVLRTLKKKD